MKEALKQLAMGLLGSKKVSALLVGLLLTLVCYPLTRWAGLDHAAALEIAKVIVPGIATAVLTYLGAQGYADKGKGQLQELARIAKEDPAAAAVVAKLLEPRGNG